MSLIRELRSLKRPAAIVTLIAAGILCLSAAALGAGDSQSVAVSVIEDDADHTVLHYTFGVYTVDPVTIDGVRYALIGLPDEPVHLIKGAPELPKVCRSIIIPDDAAMDVRVIDGKYLDIKGIDVAPSKGNLLRTIDPSTVPFEFGAEYENNAFFPAETAELSDPYIQRDYRAIVVRLNPFQYNPRTRTLRVYSEMTVEVFATGPGRINTLERAQVVETSADFQQLYKERFLNYIEGGGGRYTPIEERGGMLIIVHDVWLGNVQPLADHKAAVGFDVTMVGVSTVPGGNTSDAIKAYIQTMFDTTDLSFVLLVGDSAEVATPHAWGGAADPTYAEVAGADKYPDIMIGRFSAQSIADVETQVMRTIEYETMPAPMAEWFKKGVGIASNQGPGDDGEYDNEHMDVIRGKLLDYGYTYIDQIYDPTGTKAQVSNALNDGRGIINYCGHGSTTSWSTTGFSNSDVNALVNDNMLPFITNVACVVGDFDGPTCFAEAWMRATNGSEPTGAIGTYASSINQSWNPPMSGQDGIIDAMIAETCLCFGTLCYSGSSQMIDDYGNEGVDMFETWHIFGDPSLRVFLTCSDQGTATLDRDLYACESTMSARVNDCGLNLDSGALDTVMITATSDTEPAGEEFMLTEIGADLGEFTGTLTMSMTDAPGVLQVSPGDMVTVTYIDADDGQGGTNIVVEVTASIDCDAPLISGIETIDVMSRKATVLFETDEPAKGTLHYGTECGDLNLTLAGGAYETSHSMLLSGLDHLTTYFYAVEAEDKAGNLSYDDNLGECYSFTTLESALLLIVDDDDNAPDVASYYLDALDAMGHDYEIWNTGNSDNEPDLSYLAPFKLIIWFTGGSYGGSAGPGVEAEAVLSQYLDAGGCLFISSQDWLYDKGMTPLMTDYLGVLKAQSDVTQNTVEGVTTPFDGFGPYSLQYPFSNYSDKFKPNAAGAVAFSGNAGDAALLVDNGIYRSTFWGFPFEAIPDAAERNLIMDAIVNWCVAPVTCEGDANGDGTVDPLDSGYVLARFGCEVGTGDPECDLADQNLDGVVDPLDVGFVLARFGPCE